MVFTGHVSANTNNLIGINC